MARLPTPGQDNGTWGDILNDYLSQSHKPDGTLKDNAVGTNQIQSGAVTNAQLDSSTQSAVTKASSSVQKVNSKTPDGTGNVALAASDVSAVPISAQGVASGVATLDSSSTLTSSQLPSSVVSGTRLFLPGQPGVGGPLTQIKGFGHSYMAYPNIALNQASDTYMARLAAALSVTNNNLGVPGGVLMAALAASSGGWQYVFNQLPRGSGSARDQIVILNYGIDDVVAAKTLSAPYSAAFSAALAATISRIRATPGSIKLANDASIAYSSGWTYDSGSTFGVPVQYSFTSGNTYTITLPSSFPGGTVCIDLLTAVTDGATHTFTLDGNAAGSINIVGNSGGVEITPSVFRIPGVKMGAHTIVGTISALSGATTRTEVVGWHHETAPLPVVICLKQQKLIDYSAFGAHAPNDTDVATINTAIDTVCAAFDSNVVSVDLDGIMAKQQALFMYYDGLTSDWVHPGPLGHKLIASVLRNVIRTHPAISDLVAITQ